MSFRSRHPRSHENLVRNSFTRPDWDPCHETGRNNSLFHYHSKSYYIKWCSKKQDNSTQHIPKKWSNYHRHTYADSGVFAQRLQ